VVGNDDYLGAIYQYATPGWAIDNSGAVIGCLLRNTPGRYNAFSGSDDDSHTVSFAVAVPGVLQSPGKKRLGPGSMLAAALHLNNPVAAPRHARIRDRRAPAVDQHRFDDRHESARHGRQGRHGESVADDPAAVSADERPPSWAWS
jgi:hypothetical protein